MLIAIETISLCITKISKLISFLSRREINTYILYQYKSLWCEQYTLPHWYNYVVNEWVYVLTMENKKSLYSNCFLTSFHARPQNARKCEQFGFLICNSWVLSGCLAWCYYWVDTAFLLFGACIVLYCLLACSLILLCCFYLLDFWFFALTHIVSILKHIFLLILVISFIRIGLFIRIGFSPPVTRDTIKVCFVGHRHLMHSPYIRIHNTILRYILFANQWLFSCYLVQAKQLP